MKLVCQLDHSGYFVGTTYADEDPLVPGNWLIPGGCVDVVAPEIPVGKRARWVAGNWVFEDAANNPDVSPLPSDPIEALLSQIVAIERQTLMSRPMRELLLLMAQRADMAPGNLPYTRVKEVEDQIEALRAQVRMEAQVNE